MRYVVAGPVLEASVPKFWEEVAMPECLVDVMDANGQVIHTYPIMLKEDIDGNEAEYLAKALVAAAHGQLVPDNELAALTARLHNSRGGRMQPHGDNVSTSSETIEGLEQSVRERAYALWEQEGSPQGQAEEFWHQALEQHLRERAYALWQQEGALEGGAEEDWKKTQDFQAS